MNNAVRPGDRVDITVGMPQGMLPYKAQGVVTRLDIHGNPLVRPDHPLANGARIVEVKKAGPNQ